MPCKLRLLALLAKAVLAPQSTYAVGSGGEGGAVGCLPVLMVCVFQGFKVYIRGVHSHSLGLSRVL